MDSIYQAPNADLERIEHDPKLTLNPETLTPLVRSRVWAILLGWTSITYFLIHLVLFFLELFYIAISSVSFSASSMMLLRSVISTMIYALFLLLGINLIRFGKRAGALSQTRTLGAFEQTLHAQSRFWMFIAVSVIALFLIGLIAFGFFLFGYFMGHML